MTPLAENIKLALAFAQAVAPNGSDQQAAATMCETMRKEGESEKNILLALTGFVYDGLAYGNWPSAFK